MKSKTKLIISLIGAILSSFGITIPSICLIDYILVNEILIFIPISLSIFFTGLLVGFIWKLKEVWDSIEE